MKPSRPYPEKSYLQYSEKVDEIAQLACCIEILNDVLEQKEISYSLIKIEKFIPIKFVSPDAKEASIALGSFSTPDEGVHYPYIEASQRPSISNILICSLHESNQNQTALYVVSHLALDSDCGRFFHTLSVKNKDGELLSVENSLLDNDSKKKFVIEAKKILKLLTDKTLDLYLVPSAKGLVARKKTKAASAASSFEKSPAIPDNKPSPSEESALINAFKNLNFLAKAPAPAGKKAADSSAEESSSAPVLG